MHDAPLLTTLAKLLGLHDTQIPDQAHLRADYIDTRLGKMIAVSDADALHLLEFTERRILQSELQRLWHRSSGSLGVGRFAPTDQIEAEMDAFMSGQSDHFGTRLAPFGTRFSKEVWHHLRTIPAGQTRSYSDVANAIGRPTAVRAVGRANGANPIAIAIPCHRVLAANGALTGYGGGLWRKRALIDLERGYFAD